MKSVIMAVVVMGAVSLVNAGNYEGLKNTSGVPFAEMKIAKKAAEPVKLSGDFKSAPKATVTEIKKKAALGSEVPALAAEKTEPQKAGKKGLSAICKGWITAGAGIAGVVMGVVAAHVGASAIDGLGTAGAAAAAGLGTVGTVTVTFGVAVAVCAVVVGVGAVVLTTYLLDK